MPWQRNNLIITSPYALQATKTKDPFADFVDDEVEMDSDDESDASDFDDDLDPDKIEVPGELRRMGDVNLTASQ